MRPNCEFCHHPAVSLCCVKGCSNLPYLCQTDCVSFASQKIHQHPESSHKSSISCDEFERRIHDKLGQNEEVIDRITKSFRRVIHMLERQLEEYEVKMKSTLKMVPKMEQLLEKKSHWCGTLTGDHVYALLQEPFHTSSSKEALDFINNLYSKTLDEVEGSLTKQQRHEEKHQLLSKADQLVKRNNFFVAIPMLEDCHAIDPFDFKSQYLLGYCLMHTGHKDKALLLFSKCVEIEPSYPESYCFLSTLHFQLGEYNKAIGYCNTAIRLNPNEAKYYVHRAQNHRMNHNASEAVKDLTKAIQLDPEKASLFNLRGKVHMDMQQNQQALVDFSVAISMERKAEYYHNRASLLKRLGRWREEKNDRETVEEIERDPLQL